ncbi:MAG: hypothetical protein K5864_09165 [Bacteroidales bacterium]|nr:hypothetical protein [Bacteroidales bacterium]
MKKVFKYMLVAMMAISTVALFSCGKDDEGEDNGGNNNGGQEQTTNPINGHTFEGTITDQTYEAQGYVFTFDFVITATSETRMDYNCDIAYNGETLGSDNDKVTYTFENNAGTLTFDADGYSTNYTYNPQNKTITFNISYQVAEGVSAGGTAVLTQVD